MACLITNGTSDNGCKQSIGGIETLYLANRSEVASVTTDVDGEVTAITMESGAVFYEFGLNKDSSNYDETSDSPNNSGTVVTQVITAVLGKRETAKRAQLESIIEGETIAIVKDKLDKFWIFGEKFGLVGTVNAATGTAKSDVSAYTLTLTGEELKLAKELESEAVITAVL